MTRLQLDLTEDEVLRLRAAVRCRLESSEDNNDSREAKLYRRLLTKLGEK